MGRKEVTGGLPLVFKPERTSFPDAKYRLFILKRKYFLLKTTVVWCFLPQITEKPARVFELCGFSRHLITLRDFFNLAAFIDEGFIHKTTGFIGHFERFSIINRRKRVVDTIYAVFFYQMHLDHVEIFVGKYFGV